MARKLNKDKVKSKKATSTASKTMKNRKSSSSANAEAGFTRSLMCIKKTNTARATARPTPPPEEKDE